MPPVLQLVIPTADDMRALGEAVGALLRPGDVVALTGDLGAGKTTFVQGAARGLGVDGDQVTSPTFTLVKEYRGRTPVYHLDVYRLDRIQEVIDLGFEELLDPDGVAFVEWGDAIEGLLPEGHLELSLHTRADDDVRQASLSAGRPWSDRWERLEAAAARWRAGAEGTAGAHGNGELPA